MSELLPRDVASLCDEYRGKCELPTHPEGYPLNNSNNYVETNTHTVLFKGCIFRELASFSILYFSRMAVSCKVKCSEILKTRCPLTCTHSKLVCTCVWKPGGEKDSIVNHQSTCFNAIIM